MVGGGTVGAWCAYFLRRAGLARVVLIEKGFLGQGASSRAAGVVRVQGGTQEAVRLSSWSRRFYLGQRDEIGTDSGFTEQGYLLPCFTEADVAAAHERMAMQTALGVPVRWLEAGACAHRRQSAGYRPPPWLQHVIRVRQQLCVFPGCGRAARRCDLDHTIPYHRGGRTCECNVAPLCRKHHQAKQARGWRLDQPQPGIMIWTTPSGRRYTTGQASYPS